MKHFSNTDEHDSYRDMLDYIRDNMKDKDREALKALLNNKHGRWFLMRLLDRTKVNSEAFTGNSTTFYNEGRRSIGVELINDIAALGLTGFNLKQKAEKEYVKVQTEYKELYIQRNLDIERKQGED